MKKLAIILVALLGTFSFIIAGCSCKKDASVIRLNEVTHSVFYAPLYVAINKGYFEEEGITIELTNGGGANNTMTALVSDSADIGLCGPEAAIYVVAQGSSDVPVVFGQLTKRDGSFIVGRNDIDFHWSDLLGTEILAGRRGGVPAMTLEYALNQNGLYDGQNITLNYDVAFNNMAPAFQSGIGDYTTLFEPTASEFAANGFGYILASVGQEAGEVPFTAFMSMNSYLEQNTNKVKGFLRAIYKGYTFLTTADVEDVVDALEPSFEGTSRDLLRYSVNSYKAIDAWASTPVMSESAYNRLITIMTNAGELTTPVAFADVVDNTLASEVMLETI